MTYEEAKSKIIVQLTQARETIECLPAKTKPNDLIKAYILALESLEKQIPTTVEKDDVDGRGYTDLFICGKCSTYIQTPLLTKICEYNYCPWCGNRLGGEE